MELSPGPTLSYHVTVIYCWWAYKNWYVHKLYLFRFTSTPPTLFYHTVMSDMGPKRDKLAPNGTNPELFQIRFQYTLAHLKTDLKKSQICPFWCHSNPLWARTWQRCSHITVLCSPLGGANITGVSASPETCLKCRSFVKYPGLRPASFCRIRGIITE